MKCHMIIRSAKVVLGIAMTLVILFIGVNVGVALCDPAFPKLKASCDNALRKTPNTETLDQWLKANGIPFQRREGPLYGDFQNILIQEGIPLADLHRSSSCTYFESLHVRGFFARHVAYGYFLFAADGSLINYHISDISYGM